MKLRFLTGAIIAFHGLYRIVFIEEYTDFIYDNFSQIIPFETLLMVGSAIFPFLEFFIGLLIIFNLGKKVALMGGFFISLIMSTFIIFNGSYLYLIYHATVITLLAFLYFKQVRTSDRKIIL
tara:strand:- start:421 stop:786 length:366 start_codon:yes stop_codon:yes gene_type:complete